MHVLFHHRTQGQGVEAVHIQGILSALIQAGHQVTLLSPPGVTVGGEQTTRQRSRWKGIRFVPEILFEMLELVYNGVSWQRLKKQIRTHPFDWVYERYAFLHFAGAVMAQKAKIPFFLEVNFTTETPLYRKRSRFIQQIERVIERYIFSKADHLFVVSTTLKNRLVQKGIASHRITVTPNAVDETIVTRPIDGETVRQQWGWGARPVIGFVGGFYPWHGVHLLLEVFPQIARAVPDAILLLVGEGPLKKDLQEQAHAMGASASIVFTGNIPHEKLPPYITAFDIAVMPDSNDYGSPMKIYEYMAMGKPVVAPKIPPIEDGVIDNQTGLLFPKQDPQGLAEALITLLQDPKRRLRMGEAARQHVLKNHTWQKNVEAILAQSQKTIRERNLI